MLMRLDECVKDIRMAQRIVQDKGAEIFCLKISNLAGLSQARKVQDYLLDTGDTPGLGVEPDFDSLGTAIAVYQ